MAREEPYLKLVADNGAVDIPRTARPRQDSLSRDLIETLYVAHKDELLSFLRKLLRNPDEAVEVLQETYFRLLNRESVEGLSANAKAYLFSTAKNLVVDRARRRLVRARAELAVTDCYLPYTAPPVEPETSAHWGQVARLYEAALRDLAPLTRQIFLLHKHRKKTYSEVARELGVSSKTVERHVAKAMRHVHSCLGHLLS